MRVQKIAVCARQGHFPRPRQSAEIVYLPRGQIGDPAGLEFGDQGRDPRFLPGWWILPGLLLASPFMIELARHLM